MKLPGILPLLLLSVCVVLAPAVSHAGSKATPTPRPHHYNKIVEISATSITTSDDKVTKTYKIDKDTEITLLGETATVDKLAAGMKVEVDPGIDQDTAGAIKASNPPRESKK